MNEFTVDFGWFKEQDKIEIDKVSGVVVKPDKVTVYGKFDGENVEYEKSPEELKFLTVSP